jgi:hypothetical protein
MSGSLTLSGPGGPALAPAGPAEALGSPLLRAMMLWALYAVPVVVAVRPVGDPVLEPDVWWHLRVGQWVAEHHAVPLHDPFTTQGRPWAAYSSLFELLLYGLYAAFGLAGVVVYRVGLSLAVTAALHAFVRRLERRFLVATALTAAALLAVGMLFSERPWLFTILFTTLTLHAVVVLRRPGPAPRWVWGLPAVYVLWASLHIQFVYGLFVLGLACVAPLIDRRLGRAPADEGREMAGGPGWRLLGLSAACLLATLANPYGLGVYRVVIEYATQPGPFRYINELRALEFREACDWVMLALTGAACWALGRRRPGAFEVLLLVVAAALAFRARRDLWFVVLADLLILASAGPGVGPLGRPFSLAAGPRALVALALAVLAAFCAWVQDLSPAGLARRVDSAFPAAAARAVRRQGLAGPLYNDFNWGGYLIWALPGMPVNIDGRTNLHGDERIERIGKTWAGLPGWDEDPELERAGVVLGPTASPLASLLLRDGRFRRVYRDELASVFVRER